MTYRLEIEGEAPLDGAAVAAQVQWYMTDPRGRQPIEHVAFVRTRAGSFDLILASPTMSTGCATRWTPSASCPAATATGSSSTRSAG